MLLDLVNLWRRPSVRAVLMAATVFVLGSAVEALIVQQVAQDIAALEFISDTVLAIALGVSTFLWLRLRGTREALAEAERTRVVFETQLSMAADIQRRLLPQVPPSGGGVRWAASLVQAHRIGGDYYDFKESGHHQVALIADISGKGIPAALLLAYMRAVFHETVRRFDQPAEIVSALSRAVFQDTGGSPYLTAIVVRLDCAARRLTYCNAGHPPGLLLAREAIRRLDAGGPPIGLFPEIPYQQDSMDLDAGAIGVFVTDGVTERLPDGTDTLARLLVDLARTPQSAESMCAAVQAAVAGSSGPPGIEDWQDDRTVVAFVHRPSQSQPSRL